MITSEVAVWLIEEFVIFKSHDPTDDQKRLCNILKIFEEGIRKDQDKITRHACAENILKMKDIADGDGGMYNVIEKDHTHSVIMNTNALKED